MIKEVHRGWKRCFELFGRGTWQWGSAPGRDGAFQSLPGQREAGRASSPGSAGAR